MRPAQDLAIGVLSGAAAAVLFLLAAFLCLLSGWATTAAVIASIILVATAATWIVRRPSMRVADPAASRWARNLRRVLVSALASSALALVVAFAGNGLGQRPPSQAVMAAIFEEGRTDFEALREMVVADGLSGVSDEGKNFERIGTRSGDPAGLGISAERAELYRRRMTAVGAPTIRVSPDGSVYFVLRDVPGSANRHWHAAMTWSREKPSPLLPTLDGFLSSDAARGRRRGYSAVGDHWYAVLHW